MDGVCIVALPAGDKKVKYKDGDSTQLHQTLAYLGKASALTYTDKAQIIAATERLAQSFKPFTAKVGGEATLGPDQEKVVLTDSDDLQRMHDQIVSSYALRQLYKENAHPTWVSHVTGSGLKHGDTIKFDRVAAWIGDEKITFDIGTATVVKRDRSMRPSPKSTPKEIGGSHGHRPHGPSILWPAMYEHLRAKGYTKEKSARISNAAWKKKRMGMKTNTPTSARGIMKSVCPDLADDLDTLLLVSRED